MADLQKRVRSPKFPFIDLKTAIERADAFYQSEKRNSASIPVAMKAWGYNDKSSGGLQTVSALKEFGLMEDSGSGDGRRVKLTDRALRINLDKREDSQDRSKLIKEAALLPKIHSSLWQQHQGELPSDNNLRHYLLFDYETPFNENTVEDFIAQFRATLAFAKLTASDSISSDVGDKDEAEAVTTVKVGDYVQWEPQGVLQFSVPRRVRAISEDGEWAFVDGSNTRMPLKELSVAEAPTPPKDALASQHRPKPPVLAEDLGTRQDIFSLAEGPVTIQWPASLSHDSFEDLAAWLDILKRKIGRSVKTNANLAEGGE